MREKQGLLISAAFLIAVFISGSIASVAEGQEVLSIYAPAVTNSGGAVIEIRVGIAPGGTGKLSISGAQSIGNDTLFSSILAFYISFLLSDRDPFEYNASISFNSDLSGIEGPSASLGIAEAFYILSSGRTPPPSINDTVITGAVGIDGLSIMIGGVQEKLSAACGAGAKSFALPVSNYLYDSSNLSGCSNMSLLPSAGILSLNSQLYGYGSSLFNFSASYFYPREVSDEMGNAALHYLNETLSADSSLSNSSAVDAVISSLQTGRNYTAASLALSLYVSSVEKSLMKNITSRSLLDSYLSELSSALNDTRKTLRSTEAFILLEPSIPVPALEALSTAESRLWEAENYIRESSSSNDLSSSIHYAASAQGRIAAAETWMHLAALNWSGYPSLSVSQAKNSLSKYATFLQAASSYLGSIVAESGSQSLSSYYGDLLSNLNYAVSLEKDDELFLKYALFSELTYQLSSALTSMNFQEPSSLPQYISEASKVFAVIYSNILRNGLISAIPPAYMEYSAYKGLDDETRLMMVETAISWSLPLLFISLSTQATGERYQLSVQIATGSILASLIVIWAIVGMLASLISVALYRATRRSW